jgi:hypothetical protein
MAKRTTYDDASGTAKSRYYVIGGHYCCACKGGSNAYVFVAGSPLVRIG